MTALGAAYNRGFDFERAGVQFTREISSANLIAAWEAGRIRIAEQWISGHVIVAPDRIIEWHPADADQLGAADLAPVLELDPEVVLIGSGTERPLPDVELMAALAARGIGVEIMTTPAACRTYNVLVHEGRRVVAALFNQDAGSPR